MPEQSQARRRVIAVLTEKEADALVRWGAMNEEWLPRNSPLNRATAKLDEQSAAQMRDIYAEVEDELRDALSSAFYEPQYDQFDFTAAARKIADRVLGVYD